MDERDFLSLKLMSSAEDVKDGGIKDNNTGMRGSGMQWPFSNKVSALPQCMPYKTGQEERPKKNLVDPLAPSPYMHISTAEAFDASHKTFTGGVAQLKNFSFDRHGATHYSMTTCPVQNVDAQWTHRAPETGKFYMNNTYFKTPITTWRHNFSPTTRQQPVGETPIMSQHSYVPPNSGSMAGIDHRNVSKPTGASTQLTIFYGGSVCVYNDVSPDKVQAIMHMAGNGSLMAPNMAPPLTQVQVSNSIPLGGDVSHGNHTFTPSPCSGLSSPISVTSHANAQSGSGSSGTDEVMVAKPLVASTAPSSKPEPPKAPTAIASMAATMFTAAVPQARKASLARFLEKRKERAMSTMPYNKNLSSTEGMTPSGTTGTTQSGSTGISSPPASKEHKWFLGLTKNGNPDETVDTKLEM